MFINRALICFSLCSVLVACDKDKDKPEEPVSCNSVTLISPDTTAVLFVTMEGNDLAIHQLKNGMESSVIAAAGYDFWWPKFSPNKQEIICYRSLGTDAIEMNDFATAELWKFNADGTGGHMILKLSDFNWNAMGHAQWSPNGKHLVMSAQNEDPFENNNLHWHLYVTDTAGNNPQQISNRSSYFAYPDISPDFTKITYCAWPSPVISGNTNLNEVHVANLDTTNWTISSEFRITNDNRIDDHTSFSPDGSLVGWHSYTYANDIKLHTSSLGGSITTIDPNGRVMRDPVFKSTGELMFVLRLGTYCLNHLARISTSGTNEQVHFRKLNSHFYQPDL